MKNIPFLVLLFISTLYANDIEYLANLLEDVYFLGDIQSTGPFLTPERIYHPHNIFIARGDITEITNKIVEINGDTEAVIYNRNYIELGFKNGGSHFIYGTFPHVTFEDSKIALYESTDLWPYVLEDENTEIDEEKRITRKYYNFMYDNDIPIHYTYKDNFHNQIPITTYFKNPSSATDDQILNSIVYYYDDLNRLVTVIENTVIEQEPKVLLKVQYFDNHMLIGTYPHAISVAWDKIPFPTKVQVMRNRGKHITNYKIEWDAESLKRIVRSISWANDKEQSEQHIYENGLLSKILFKEYDSGREMIYSSSYFTEGDTLLILNGINRLSSEGEEYRQYFIIYRENGMIVAENTINNILESKAIFKLDGYGNWYEYDIEFFTDEDRSIKGYQYITYDE